MESLPRPRLQRSVSERPAPLRRSSSLYGLLARVPSFRNSNSAWHGQDLDDYCSSAEDEPIAPPSPTVSPEEAKRARKQKLQRLFKQGVSKVMKERAMEMNKTAKLASLYALDAFAGRLQHGMAAMSTRPWYIYAAFRLQISNEWLWCIIACSLAHSVLVFLEPGPRDRGGDGGWLSEGSSRGLEAVFIAVYAADVALKAAYMGLKNYLKKPWQKLMIGIVLTLAVDASGLFAVRFARFLRPAILSLRTRSIRRFYTVVSNMLPGFLRVCLPVLFFLLLSASFAALSFGRAKSEFENSMSAGYAIWILMVSADNYGSLVDEPSQHPAYIPFVVMVIIVGSMFLLSLLLGVTYDVFIEHTTDQVKSERLKELRGLNKAFAIMDPEGKGKLNMVVWDRFLHHMMPRTTQQERALYFEIASGFADELDVLGFMDLRQVLSYQFVNVNAVERQGKRLKWEQKPKWLVRLLETMEGFLHAKTWKHLVTAVVLLDCLFLPYSIPHQGPGLHITRLTTGCGVVLLFDQVFQWAEWMRQGSGPGPLRLPGKSFHTKVAGVAVLAHAAVVALLYCPPLLSLVCTGTSYASAAWSSISNAWLSRGSNILDAGGCAVGFGEGQGVGEGLGRFLAEEGGYDGGWGSGSGDGVCVETDWCTDGLLSLAYTMHLLRCWRLVTLNDTLHAHVDTFFSVVPVFAQTLSFALIVAYAFAMGGMQFFADKASAFKDAGTSLKTTLQLFVGVDFSAVVEDTVAEVGTSAFLYFALYHVVGVLIVFNLLTAIMIQLYGEALNEKSRQNLEDQRQADQLLQDSLYEHNQKQRVLRLWGRSLTQRAAKLNLTRATQVSTGREARRVLGSATKSPIPTEEELSACQSYAKVDLLRALQEKTRGDRSIRTFERSMYQKLKASNGHDSLNYQKFHDGDTIYHRGDQHHCCYFVHKGVVRLEAPDGTIETKETGEMFGEEALVATLPTSATATADGLVECVGIDRATFTEAHGTLENLGHIFLRLQRSGSLSGMEAPSSDASSGRRSMFGGGAGGGSGRSRLGQPQIFRSGDLDGGGGESRSERWRASSRNFSALQLHRSTRNYTEDSMGSSNFTNERMEWVGRRDSSGVSDRSAGGRFQLVAGSSARGESFSRTFSVRREESGTRATGASTVRGSSPCGEVGRGGGATSKEETESEAYYRHHRALDLFGKTVSPAAGAGAATHTTAPSPGVRAPTEKPADSARSVRDPNSARRITCDASDPAALLRPVEKQTRDELSPRGAKTSGSDSRGGAQGFRAQLRRDYGRIGVGAVDDMVTDESSKRDEDEGMNVESSLCPVVNGDNVEGGSELTSSLPKRDRNEEENGHLKKNAELVILSASAACDDAAGAGPSGDGGESKDDPGLRDDTKSESAPPTGYAGGSADDEVIGGVSADCAHVSRTVGASSVTPTNSDHKWDADRFVSRQRMLKNVAKAAPEVGRGKGGADTSDAQSCEGLDDATRVSHPNREEGKYTATSNTPDQDSSEVRGITERGLRAEAMSSDLSVCGDGGSPDVSPSAPPPGRRKGPLLSASRGRSSMLRREDGKSAGGSGMSTWSTTSPSPVLGTERKAVAIADEE